MRNVLFDRCENPLAEPIEDGKIMFSTNGNGKMYLDNGTERLEMGGAKEIDAMPSKVSENAIQNKAVTNNFPQNTDVINELNTVKTINEPSIPCGTLAVKELNNNINKQLVINDVPFTFDFRDGEYGYNTDPNRGADTFHPFKRADAGVLFRSSPVDMKKYTKRWKELTDADFVAVLDSSDVTVWSRAEKKEGTFTLTPSGFSYDKSSGQLSFTRERSYDPSDYPIYYSPRTSVFWYGTIGGKR